MIVNRALFNKWIYVEKKEIIGIIVQQDFCLKIYEEILVIVKSV